MHGARPLTDLGASHENPRPTFSERERGLRGQLDLSAAGKAGTVEKERQTDPAIAAGELTAPAFEVGARRGFPKHLERARVAAQPLSGGRGVAGPERVDLAQPDGIDADGVGNSI